ncbi:DUF4906 domain-containing protein [Parabacteroides sp. AF17-28]|uniref:fimbrial protein n=1 Tax=Parabacteroides sp. AF17-28 TaxID=2292241 RepID=UPI000EFEFA88|nr:DUF4906 domain-containing protein [Parabacteroides sp. AF17-28]RHR53959.1 DUF4906 domain-containing protein [Parabacteroides sp. AF17-28]
MKQYILTALCTVCAIFTLFSCADDELVKKGDNVVEGIPTKVNLSFTAAIPAKIETKAALPTVEEFRVHNLYLFVFNANTGEREYGELLSGGELGIISEKNSEGQVTKGKIAVELLSGNKRIYAIANVPDGQSSIAGLKADLDGIMNVDDLLENEANLLQQTIYRSSGKLLMTGVYGGESTNGNCTIAPSGTTLEPISLKRVDARITFNIGIASGGKDKKFTAKKWQVVNVPKRISLFQKEADISSSENDFFKMGDPISFETTNEAGQASFTFYMWENRKSATGLSQYRDRELQDKAADDSHPGYVENGAFVNAPEYSTYVVLTGDYYEKYTENGLEKERTADVTYTIHLGYVNNQANDFRTERNTTYIYNVTIQNVNDIRLEVTSFQSGKGQEPSPGAEGNIVETDKFYQIDAHYDRDIIVFNKEAIEGRAGFKLKTPFDEGYFSDGNAGSKPLSDAKDYNWVHFRIHKKSKSYNKYYYDKKSYQKYNSEEVIDIKGLLEELKKDDIYDDRGEVVYTMFIDEFYYTSDPSGKNSSNQLWKKFVNQPNREMHILCNTAYSQDRESSLTTSSVMISQRSIKTFYNEDAGAGLKTAWGIETINETGKLTPPNSNPWDKNDLSTDNGRWNFFSQTGLPNGKSSKEWDSYISNAVVSSGNHLSSNLDNGAKLVWACLQRNRDENGNDKIDADEIKWYPASINQYTDIWIGKDALPVEAHLYPNGSNIYWRYLSSNGNEFYAEEGSSINGYKFLYANGIKGASAPTSYDYRCVRNLGMDSDAGKPASAENGMPDDYVTVGAGEFTFPYINKDALRGENDVQKAEFAVHTELDPANRPYIKGFEYKNAENINWLVWEDMRDLVDRGQSPCAKYNKNGVTGWRLPNQRELSLMASRSTAGWSESYYHWARTTSSLSGKTNLGYGGRPDFISIPAKSNDYRGPVRCVRDKY